MKTRRIVQDKIEDEIYRKLHYTGNTEDRVYADKNNLFLFDNIFTELGTVLANAILKLEEIE